MHNIQIFKPQELKERPSLVIAMPGIVSREEPTRIDNLLESICGRQNTIGIRYNYADVIEEKKILCNIDASEMAEEIKEIIGKCEKNYETDNKRIGLIANSLSAIPATEYLTRTMELGYPKISCFVAISPILGWNYFAISSQKFKERLIQGEPLCISTSYDKNRGFSRIIPQETLRKLREIDCLESLRVKSCNFKDMNTMTLIGKQDTKADPQSMRYYHELLNGKLEDRIELDAGHEVPNSNSYIIGFITQHLA